MASATPLSPTFYGHVASTQDALLLIEACLRGTLNHVARHPYDHETVGLTKSGNIFIYEEHSSGIKQWTDGVPWTSSRVLGNFLVYRELERSSLLEENQRASKFSKGSPDINKQDPVTPVSPAVSILDFQSLNSLCKQAKRSLIDDLVDFHSFKEDRLVKKTFSVTVGDISHHLVSYCTVADIIHNKFTTPTKDARFQHITPRPELTFQQKFRTSVLEVDAMGQIDNRSVHVSCL